MKFKFTLIVLLLFSSVGLCQNVKPTAHQLSKLFKSSIDQESKKSISAGNGAWIICNQDSSFFKADTLRVYNNVNYFYQLSSCCKFIGWTFYNKNSFIQSDLQICNEPASSSIKNYSYQISIFSEKQKTYMLVIKPQITSEKFEVIKIEDIKLANNNLTKAVTLKRVANNHFFIR
jgi:hypothetical protein